MKIIVTLKHVPETGAVALDETTGTMKREGVESIPNPLDLYAVEAALRLRERYGGTITALSMGPAGADRSLREVIAMGCDDAVLVTGREFAGSDTLATSRALSRAIGRLGGCDLVISGERATDGDTGQVGPGTAALLDVPLAAYVSTIEGLEQESSGGAARLIVERLTEEGYEQLAISLPALITVVKEVATPRLPTLRGKQRARTAEIPRWGGDELGLQAGATGLAGSPTRVERIFHPRISRDGELLVVKDEATLEEASTRLAEFILHRLPGRARSLSANAAVPGAAAPSATAETDHTMPSIRKRATDAGGGEVWLIAEDRAGHIDAITWELIGRARPLADAIGGRLVVVVMTGSADPSEIEELFRRGADRVLCAEAPELLHFIVETRSRLLVRLVREHQPKVLLAAATTSGRALMPHVAVRLGTGLTADCTELDIDPESAGLLQTRPAIGGNIMATIRTRDTLPNMATVRPHSAPPAPPLYPPEGEIVRIPLASGEVDSRAERRALRPFAGESMALQDAPVIVSCGHGFHRKEKLAEAERLAAVLGAAVGASREAVDRGWLTYPHQVGLSGKTVSPELYLALGISGAVQHLAGIKTAKSIAAVNLDPDAPIFKVADFGVVGDLFAVVPLVVEKLRAELGAK